MIQIMEGRNFTYLLLFCECDDASVMIPIGMVPRWWVWWTLMLAGAQWKDLERNQVAWEGWRSLHANEHS